MKKEKKELQEAFVEEEEDLEDDGDLYSFDDEDYCYECQGYGDDYSIDENGELVCNCDICLLNPDRSEDDMDDD